MFTTVDQHELENNLNIPLDTATKRYIRRFLDVKGEILTCYLRSFKVVCPLECRNTGKLLNGQNAHLNHTEKTNQ